MLDNNLKSDEENKTISHAQQNTEPQPKHTHHDTFDEETFMQLDVKIRQGEATDAEDDTYAKLVPRKAEQRVRDYQRSPEELE